LVPTIAPGSLFTSFCTDDTLNVRWLTAKDPAYYETLNRPIVDVALRSLIIAKAVDNLYASLGHEALYPFLIQPRVGSGSYVADIPINWIWSLEITAPQKWHNFRLAHIKRISGVNDLTSGYTGMLRVVFSATQIGSNQEVYLLQADYQIDSTLAWQIAKLKVCTNQDESYVVNQDEVQTLCGSITFHTMDTNLLLASTFLNTVAPPLLTSAGPDGLYLEPAIYDTVDSLGGGSASVGNFSTTSLSHGSGLITEAAWIALPQQDSDVQAWLNAMNYPFDQNASLLNIDGNITIPTGLFREFIITVPAGDEPNGISDSSYFPIWIDSVQLLTINQARFFFSTYNDSESLTGSPGQSLQPVQFAYVDIFRTGAQEDRLPIIPYHNLKLKSTDPLFSVSGVTSEWTQHFGRGHVVLSSIWTTQPAIIAGFFADLAGILTTPQITEFTQATTRISSFGMSAVPRYTPTAGQSRALSGSTSRLAVSIDPSEANRYVTEQDQGLGNTVDLESQPNIAPIQSIARYGNTGGLCHRIVNLTVYSDQLPTNDPDFYNDNVLPRLVILLGRQPVFGDIWYNGTRFVVFNGDTWQD